MKEQMMKRVAASSMAAVMTVALAGACGYQNTAYVCAEERHADNTEAEKEKLEEKLDGMLGDSTADKDGGLGKEESVYIKADASGNVKTTTVTEWLKNPGNGAVTDASELKDIKNIKGEETFTQGSGNALSWNADGTDIYYQGTTDKKAPVGVEITYTLDGKTVSPDELEGKSGHLEMNIQYLNDAKEMVDVDGKQEEMYTPFTMVTAMMLPVEEYQNVTIDSGKIISDADHDIVVGVGFPGLEANLKLDELDDVDLDLPDHVTIEADVTDVSVHPSLTIASTEILEQFDLTDAQDFDSLEDSIDQLQNAADELTKGSSDAADGAKALSDGSTTLNDGAKTLADGVHTLNDKSKDLIAGTKTLSDGILTYTSGVDKLAEGTGSLSAGAASVNAGAAQIQGGIAAAKQGADQLMAGYVGADGNGGVVAGADALKNGLQQLQAALGQAQAGTPEIQEAQSQLAGQMAELKRSVDALVEGSAQLADGIGQLRDGTAALQTGLGQLEKGSNDLVAGTGQLTAGADALNQGASELHANSGKLTAGAGQLTQGGTQLSTGIGQLTEGADRLAGGAKELSDGAAKLSDGNKQLSEGMSKFKAEGVDKLADVFQGDVKNVTSRMKAMVTLGQNYKSFTGINSEMNGTTKFIIECE